MPTQKSLPSMSRPSRFELLFDIAIELGHVSRRIRARFAERTRATSQTEARWIALFHLASVPEGLVQSDLAERMGITAPTLVKLVDGLEAKGLVIRLAEKSDRRTKRVKLQPPGRAMLDEIDKVAAAFREEIFAGVTDEDLATTLSVLNRVSKAVAPRFRR